MDPRYDKKLFARWIRGTREIRGLNEQEFADKLGLSIGTTFPWETELNCWAIIPSEIKRKIVEILGDFPSFKTETHSKFRQGSAFEHESELKVSIDESYLELYCPKCGSPILIKDNGRCPNCGSPADNAH